MTRMEKIHSGALPRGIRSMAERWEYKIVYFPADQWTGTGLPADINERFDEYGAEGWELVGTETIIRPSLFRGAGRTVGLVGFFKRRLSA